VWTSRDAQTGDIHLCPKPSEVRRQTRLREWLALMGLSDTHMQNLLSISVQVFAPWCKIEASSMRLFPFLTEHTQPHLAARSLREFFCKAVIRL